MPQQTIGIGTSPNDGTGDPLRTAFNKTNSNFTELYTGKLDTTALTSPGPIGSTTPSSGAFTTLSASSTVSGNGFTSLFASPPAIGSTTPGTGAFTTLQLGAGGPLFKNSSGTIQARNNADNAFAPFSAGNIICGSISATADLYTYGTMAVGTTGGSFEAILRIERNASDFIRFVGARGGASGQNNLHLLDIVGTAQAFTRAFVIRASQDSGSTYTNLFTFNTGQTLVNTSHRQLQVTDTTASTSTTTGALTVAGGVGIAGAANIGGNASVGSLTVNGGLYVRQQAVPSSPVTGQRWDEIDGSGLHIYSWYYDGTDWVGVPLIPTGMPPTIVIAAATTPQLFVFPIPSFASRVLLVPPFVFGYKTGATNDGSNNLTMEFRRGTTANVSTNSNGTSLSGHQPFSTVFTKSTSAESPNSNYTFSANLSEKMPSGFTALGISVTGVGSPSLLNPAGLVYGNFRLIR